MFKSISTKLFVSVLTSALIGIGTSSYLFFRVLEEREKRNISNNVALKVQTITVDLSKTETLVESTAVDLLSLKENGITDPEVYEKFIYNRFLYGTSSSEFIVALGFGQEKGAVLPNKGLYAPYFVKIPAELETELPIGKRLVNNKEVYKIDLKIENYPQQPYYIIPVTTKEAIWFPTFYWYGLLSTVYIAPIVDSNYKVLGITGVTFSLDPISERIDEPVIKSLKSGFYILIDQNGTVLSHPSIQNVTRQYSYQDVPELKNVGKRILEGNLPKGQVVTEGNFIAFERIQGPNWLLIAVVPERVVWFPVITTTLTGLVGSILVLSFVVYTLVQGLNKKLKPITDKSLDLLKRDLNRRISLSFETTAAIEELNKLENYTLEDIYKEYAIDNNKNKKDELDYLMFTFNVMSNRLEESIEHLEDTVAERTKELKIQKDRADIASQAKSEFLASVSHELRTPLNSIIGYTEILLRSRKITETEKPKLEIVNNCSHQLLNLINDILDITKIESRKLEINKSLFPISDLLNSVLDICYSSCSQKGIDFFYKQEGELPPGVITDEKRLRQVLINLLSNAIKFTKRGSVTFTVTGEKTDKTANSYRLSFQVKDTGVGIPADQIEKIFTPFEQSSQTRHKFEGTGLGLSISNKILKELGSQIQVESKINVGSTFWFILDTEGVTEGIESRKSREENTILGVRGESRNILVVDDRWENRALLTNLLEPLNFNILEAENGIDAIDKLKDFTPDLIISDIAMPELDGFGLLAELKTKEEFKDIPVIISSASVFDTDRLNSLKAGATEFIPKPIDYNKLLQTIKQVLNVVWEYEKVEPE